MSEEDRKRYDALFVQSDIDKDGFVSGNEIKDVFLKSGVPQATLAHIWLALNIATQFYLFVMYYKKYLVINKSK